MKKLRWFGEFAVIVCLLVWCAGVPLYVLYGEIPAVAVTRQNVPEAMITPAVLTAAGSAARPIRVAWMSPPGRRESAVSYTVRDACIAEFCHGQDEALRQPPEYFDLVVVEGFRYFSDGFRFFSDEAERMMLLELWKRTRRSGIMVLPSRMLSDLPPATGIPLVLPGGEGSGFVAVSPAPGVLPDTGPEELERRLCVIAGDRYWPQGVYPALYPDPGRRFVVPPASPRRKPLLGVWQFRPVLIVTASAALFWMLLRLALTRRESVAQIFCRGENAAAFAFVLLLAARMSLHLEFRIGSTPWDVLALVPFFWIGGGLFFRGRRVLALASILAAASLFVFFRDDWLVSGSGWGFFGVLLFAAVIAASERWMLRKQHELPFRRAFFAELGGFVIACGLWLLVREQPLDCQLVALAIPAGLCRLSACRNLF